GPGNLVGRQGRATVDQQERAGGDQAGGRRVPGDDEQHAVGDRVSARPRLVREFMGELGEQVVARCDSALVEQVAEVRLKLAGGVACGLQELDLALVREALPKRDHLVVDPGNVLGGNAEYAADDLQGQRAREVRDEVHPPVVDHSVDQCV